MTRKWYVSLSVVGLGGLGLLFASERGRRAAKWVLENFHRAPDALAQWNDKAQEEMDRIQTALDRVARSLGVAH